ncbi:MAG TPA: class I SAM-dependent methyltransferase [Trichocoleus sp.]
MLSKKLLHLLIASVGLVGLGAMGCTQQRNFEAEVQDFTSPAQTQSKTVTAQVPNSERSPDVVYVPTPMPVVEEMLRLADVQSDDVIYDLGSGDGRIVITAAKQYGTRGVGIDIDPQRIQEANQNAQESKVTNRVTFRQEDLFQTDFSEATVVTLYLLPELNLRLRPKLLGELKPGTRIVSHAFDMGEWKPDQVVEVAGKTVYYWVVPEEPPANLM